MGLDMYLTKRIYIGGNYSFENVTGTIDITKNGKRIPINLNKVEYIEEEAGYWRKANAIHKWFVDNVQDGVDECQKSWVDKSKLKELRAVVQKVLKDHSLAEKLLPTCSGCFFGNYDYDEWYFEDLKKTRKIINDILKDLKDNDSTDIQFYYQSSW
jgi:hypothetical protein